MNRIIGFILLSSTLSNALPFPFPAAPIGPTVAPIVPVPHVPPSPFPLGPNGRPLGPGFNNPYYNYPGGAAVPILSYSSEHGLDGNYAFSFTTADGKQAQESGYLKDAFIDNLGNPQGTQVVQGSYAYVSPEGTPIQVSYVADENGFRPSGVHIPADGKAVVPPLEKDNRQIFDPAFNRYNPFLNRHPYPGNAYPGNPYPGNPYPGNPGQYNNGRPYDPRYPYNPSRVNPYYNNLNPYQNVPQIRAQEEAKKESA